MKILFTLIFLLPKFLWPIPFSQNETVTIIKNDDVELEHKRTLDFEIKQQVQTTYVHISKILFNLSKTKAELDAISKVMGNYQLTSLSLEISKELFYDLQNYDGYEIEYFLDYLTLIEWTNPVKSSGYRLIKNFQLVHQKELLLKPNYDDVDGKSFLITEHNLPTTEKQYLLVFDSRLTLNRDNEKYYLTFSIILALSLFYFRSVFYEDGAYDFIWRTTSFLNHLKIEIKEKRFDFNYAKWDLTTIYYEGKEGINLELIQKNYWSILENERFKFWQKTYPNIAFDFVKFKQNYHFKSFNRNLIVNKLNFKLDLIQPTKHQGSIEFYLIIIKRFTAKLQFKKLYDVKVNQFQKWLNHLDEEIINQGYDPADFNFQILENKVIINSQNPDYFDFAPVEIVYRLVSDESDDLPDLESENDFENHLEQENEFVIQKSKFNQNYFYWLFLPAGFLLVYLALFFWKKSKNHQH